MINTRPQIEYIKVELRDLDIGDVLDHSTDEQRYETIRRIEPMTMGTRLARVEDQHGNKRAVLLNNLRLHTVVSGEKVQAARRDKSLVRHQGAHLVWKGG